MSDNTIANASTSLLIFIIGDVVFYLYSLIICKFTKINVLCESRKIITFYLNIS